MEQCRIEALQRMPLFGGIRKDIIEFLLQSAPVVSIRKGEFLFREGDVADAMFVLEAGRVGVLKGSTGQEHMVRSLEQGSCFGEMSLIDLSPRSASVRALENCLALKISANCLYELYQRDIEQFAIIEMNMGREVCRRLRATDVTFESMRSSAE